MFKRNDEGELVHIEHVGGDHWRTLRPATGSFDDLLRNAIGRLHAMAQSLELHQRVAGAVIGHIEMGDHDLQVLHLEINSDLFDLMTALGRLEQTCDEEAERDEAERKAAEPEPSADDPEALALWRAACARACAELTALGKKPTTNGEVQS